MSDDMKTENADEPAIDSGPPDWPKSGALSKALAWVAWSIRKKNRAAQQNGGVRVPL